MPRYLIVLIVMLAAPAGAEEADGEGAFYVKISRGLVINYGAPSINRLRFAKVGMSVRVSSGEASDAVEHHLPLLQDSMIMLLSGYAEDAMRTVRGKEKIRKSALKQMRELLQKEEGEPYVEDVLFDNFVVQR